MTTFPTGAWSSGGRRLAPARAPRAGDALPPTREQAERLEEGVQVIRLLMTEDRATIRGRHYQLANVSYHPRPVQRPHPPIWIGAGGEQLMLPIVARQADAWHAFGSEQSMVRKSRLLDELAQRPDEIQKAILRSASLSLSRPWDRVSRRAAQLGEAGFGYLIAEGPSEGKRRRKVVTPNDFGDLADVERRLRQFEHLYQQAAKPLEWRFTRRDLARLRRRLAELPSSAAA